MARKMFEGISLNVISYLEEHVSGVSGVHFAERSPATTSDVNNWEQDNYPLLLPVELKSFLLLSDGLMLRWYINYRDDLHPLGLMYLNSISQIKRIKLEHFKMAPDTKNEDGPITSESDTSDDEENGDSADRKARRGPKKQEPWVFDLDSTSPDGGRVALVYFDRTAPPQVWFQDLSCVWFFVAENFADYFRLMLVHLGLPHWQYVFTDIGLDPVSMQWFRFVCPERLSVDLKNARTKIQAEEARPMKASDIPVHKPVKLREIDELANSGVAKTKPKSTTTYSSGVIARGSSSRPRSHSRFDSKR